MAMSGVQKQKSSVGDSNVSEGTVGVHWVEKGHMVLEVMGGLASDNICHSVSQACDAARQ